MQFLCVSCGLFGRKETIGCLRTLNDLWWRWSKHSCNHYMSGWCFWAVILFLVFWTSLIAVFFFNFSALLVHILSVQSVVVVVFYSFFFFFFNLIKLSYLTKKKKKNRLWCNSYGIWFTSQTRSPTTSRSPNSSITTNGLYKLCSMYSRGKVD